MNARTLVSPVLLLLCICFFGNLSADEPLKGKVQFSTAADADKGDFYRNLAGINLLFLRGFDKTTLNINVQGDYDTALGDDAADSSMPMSAHSRVFVREASITQEFYLNNSALDSFIFKGGVFTEKWGYTDYYNPVNVINPQDYSYHLMREWRERAIGVYALKSTLYFSQYFFIDGIVNPVFEGNNESSAAFQSKTAAAIDASVAADGSYEGTRYPDSALKTAAYGARIGVKSRDFEAHLMYYDGYDHASTLSYAIDGADLSLSRGYGRLRMLGLDYMANFANDINFKGEAAYFLQGKRFSLDDDGVSEALTDGDRTYGESPLVNYTVGLEMVKNLSDSAFIFNFEFNENIIIDRKSSFEEKMIKNRILGELQYSFYNKKLLVKSAGHYCLEDSDLGAQLELGFKPEAVYTIKAGYWLFHPFAKKGEGGLFGAYKDQDFVYLSGEVVF